MAEESTLSYSESGSFEFPSTAPPPLKLIASAKDARAILCKSLKTLAMYVNVEKEKQRLTRFGKRLPKVDPDEKVEPSEFSGDTFDYSNTEAFVHAIYVIFICIDSDEFRKRYKTCWPIHEMKMVTEFRRVTQDWLKQLIQEYPQFLGDLKVEALPGLLVNCGGDRFIVFLRQLCRLALYLVATRNKYEVKQQVLLPPKPTPDVGVNSARIKVLYARKKKLEDATRNKYLSLMRNLKEGQTPSRTLKSIHKQVLNIDTRISNQVCSLVCEHPPIFGLQTEEEWDERNAMVRSKRIVDLSGSTQFDLVRSGLEQYLQAYAHKIIEPTSKIGKFDKLWYLLEKDRKGIPSVLDCSKFPSIPQHEQGRPSLNAYMQSVITLADRLLRNEVLHSTTDPSLLSRFKQLGLRMEYLELLERGANQTLIDCDVDHKDLQMEHADLKRKVKNFDWSSLSELTDGSYEDIFGEVGFIPVFDINRDSTFDEIIRNYLDVSFDEGNEED